MKISAYQQDVVTPMFQNAKLNINLASRVLLGKQQQFDAAYQSMQNLKKDSLNIKFLNKQSRAKIYGYNAQISADFPDISSGNFDLSSSNVTEKYMKNFRAIANDTELIKNYKKDREVQGSLQALAKMKAEKDPMKAGYHAINEANFLGQVQRYIDATGDLSGHNVSYTPYVDTAREMSALSKTIPKEKSQNFQTTADGGMIEITKEGKSPSAIRASSQKYHTGRGAGQMRQEAIYSYNKIKDNDAAKTEIQNNYNDVIVSQIAQNDKMLDALKARKPKTDEEQFQIMQQIANIEQVNGQLENKQEQLLDPANFRDDAQWENWMTDLYTHQTIERDVQSYGQQSISYEYKENPVYRSARDWEATVNTNAPINTLEDIVSQGTVAGGTYESTSEGVLPSDSYINGIFDHLEDTQYKSTNPFESGVTGEYEMTPSESKEYATIQGEIDEVKKGREKFSKEKVSIVDNLKGTYQKSRPKSNNPKRKDPGFTAAPLLDQINKGLSDAENVLMGANQVEGYELELNNNGTELVIGSIEGYTLKSLEAARKNTSIDPKYKKEVEKELDRRYKAIWKAEKTLKDYKSDLKTYNESEDGFIKKNKKLSQKYIDNYNNKLQALEEKRDAITNITTLKGDDMLDIVMNVDKYRDFKKNEYLADNVYIKAARDIVKRNSSITKEELKEQVKAKVNDQSGKYYGELVRQKRIQQYHQHFFRNVTKPEHIKAILANHNTASFYTPFYIDMRGKSTGKEQTTARQNIKTDVLIGLRANLVGGKGKIGRDEIPPDAISTYRVYKGYTEITIDVTKMPGYDKDKDYSKSYSINGDKFKLDSKNNTIKFYDASLDKDLSQDFMLGIPTMVDVEYADYVGLKGRKFILQTEDNEHYDIVLIENGKEVMRAEDKKITADAIIQAGDRWAKGGSLSIQ